MIAAGDITGGVIDAPMSWPRRSSDLRRDERSNPSEPPEHPRQRLRAPPSRHDSPELERPRAAWFAAPDAAGQELACETMQRRMFIDVAYAPLGQLFQPTAHRSEITNIADGFSLFYDVRRG